jgi:hypothetical protein
MANAKVVAGATRIKQTIRILNDHWMQTEATWTDSVRRRFEDRHLAPLSTAVESAAAGLQKLAESLDQVRRDCSDRSEIL